MTSKKLNGDLFKSNSIKILRVKFEEIAENIVNRVDVPSESGYERFVGGTHLDPETLKIKRWGSTSDVYAQKLIFKKGHILFGKRRSYLRKAAYADFDGVCSAHMLVLKSKQKLMLENFFVFFMQSNQFWKTADMISEGSMSPTIKWKILAKQEFTIPSKEEQSRIANFLWAIEKTIGQIDGVIIKAQRLKKSLMQRLLTWGIGHTEYKETPLGIMPEKWKIMDLKGISRKGSQNGLYKSNSTGAPVNYIRMTELFKSDILTKELVGTINVTKKEKEKYLLKNGDLLFGRRSLKVEGAGKCVLVSGLDKDAVFESSIIRFSLNEELVDPFFCLYWFLSEIGRREIRRIVRVVTVSGVTGKDLEKVNVPVPPIDEQKQIASTLSRINNNLILLGKHKEVLAALKKRVLNDFI